MIAFDVVVRVPAAAAAGVEFDETNAALHQAAGQQAVGAELRGGLVVHAVKLLGGFGFLGQVDRFGTGGLHAIGELVGVDARFEFGVFGLIGIEVLVQSLEQIETAALLLLADGVGRIEIENRRAGVAELRALDRWRAGSRSSSSWGRRALRRRRSGRRRWADFDSRNRART